MDGTSAIAPLREHNDQQLSARLLACNIAEDLRFLRMMQRLEECPGEGRCFYKCGYFTLQTLQMRFLGSCIVTRWLERKSTKEFQQPRTGQYPLDNLRYIQWFLKSWITWFSMSSAMWRCKVVQLFLMSLGDCWDKSIPWVPMIYVYKYTPLDLLQQFRWMQKSSLPDWNDCRTFAHEFVANESIPCTSTNYVAAFNSTLTLPCDRPLCTDSLVKYTKNCLIYIHGIRSLI